MPASDFLRTQLAGMLVGQPQLLPTGLPSLPIYIALGTGTGTHSRVDLGLFAEAYNTRLKYSFESVYQAFSSQISTNYTVANPQGTYTEAGLFDQDVATTSLTAAVSAGATSLPVDGSTSPAVYGSTLPGQYTTIYLNDTTNPEYASLATAASAGATTWTLQSGLQYAHASGTPIVVFVGNLLAAVTFQSGQVNATGQALTVQFSLLMQST